MGEIAEMMLDGTLCEGCGEFIGNGYGFPQYCSDECAEGRGADPDQVKGYHPPEGAKSNKATKNRRKKLKNQKARYRRLVSKCEIMVVLMDAFCDGDASLQDLKDHVSEIKKEIEPVKFEGGQ